MGQVVAKEAKAVRTGRGTRGHSLPVRARESFQDRVTLYVASGTFQARDPHHGAVGGGGRLWQDRGMEREGEQGAAGRVRDRGMAGWAEGARAGPASSGRVTGRDHGNGPNGTRARGSVSLARAPAHARFPAPAPGPIWTAVSHYGPLFGPLWAALGHHFGPLCATLCHFVPPWAGKCRIKVSIALAS